MPESNVVAAITAYQHALLNERLARREVRAAQEREREALANVQTAELYLANKRGVVVTALQELDRALLNGDEGPHGP
jgi:hypothetical protein